MASVVTAAPTDDAPPLVLHKLRTRFGAIHALTIVIGKWLNRAKLFIFDEPAAGVTWAPGRKSIGCRPPDSRRAWASS